MIKKIIKSLDLASKVIDISPIDEIKLAINSTKLHNIISDYKSNDSIEKYIIKLLLAKERDVIDIISDNYFNNILGSIHFILGNPYSIDTKIFNIIYKNRELIKKVSTSIIDSYNIIVFNHEYDHLASSYLKKLHKFYNYELISRWYKTVVSQPVTKSEYFKVTKSNTKEKQWAKYLEVWSIYNTSCLELKEYIKKLLKFYKPIKNPVVGCSHFGKKYYENCLESYIGLDTKPTVLEKWAHKELNRLMEQMKLYIKIVEPSLDLSDPYKKFIDKISKNKDQHFSSKKELISIYQNTINKYRKIYVETLGFPEYEKPNLIIFDNAKLGGGYYYLNNFYLNVNSWKEMKKYTVESLVLHETMPGHHTQVHVMLNKTNQYSLLFNYFGSSCIGFIEGWGLFSEKLGFDQTTWDKIGQLEFEIFRTVRIIVDIGIHYHGKTPEQMTNYMEQHLTMSKNEILNEIYRYVCSPGQAVAYKIGNQVFEKILEKQNITNYLDRKAIDLYKKLIIDGPKPLKFICKDYGLNVNELF